MLIWFHFLGSDWPHWFTGGYHVKRQNDTVTVLCSRNRLKKCWLNVKWFVLWGYYTGFNIILSGSLMFPVLDSDRHPTCWAGRRSCRSPSPHIGPSPAVWRASGSPLPDPEAQKGGYWQIPSTWWAERETERHNVQNSSSFLSLSVKAKDWLTMSSEELFSFMVQEPWGRQVTLPVWNHQSAALGTFLWTNQWDHAVHQGDVLVLQTLHVSDNVGLRVVTGQENSQRRVRSLDMCVTTVLQTIVNMSVMILKWSNNNTHFRFWAQKLKYTICLLTRK